MELEEHNELARLIAQLIAPDRHQRAIMHARAHSTGSKPVRCVGEEDLREYHANPLAGDKELAVPMPAVDDRGFETTIATFREMESYARRILFVCGAILTRRLAAASEGGRVGEHQTDSEVEAVSRQCPCPAS